MEICKCFKKIDAFKKGKAYKLYISEKPQHEMIVVYLTDGTAMGYTAKLFMSHFAII